MAVRLKLSLYGQLTHRMHYNCLAGKIDFIQKQPLKTAFWGDTNRPLLTLGGPGGQNVDTIITFGVTLKPGI